MIEFKNVSKTYHVRGGVRNEVLKDINLTIQDGDIFGVIGFSGAGKSTLIRMVNSLEKPTSGEVVVNGDSVTLHSVKQLRRLKKTIGMIFQHFNLLNSKTVFENVALPMVLERKNKEVIQKRVDELLEYVELQDKAQSFPSELSGGQKQRVGIARALALRPSILLCDEATSALDPQTTESILTLLKRINAEYHITIVIITHEMGVIQKICNRVAVIEQGRVIESGNVLDVFGNPQQETTKHFVKTVLQDDISESAKLLLLRKNSRGRLFKLKLVGEVTYEPIVETLVSQFHIGVNIVFATMTEIQETTLGHMVLQLTGPQTDIEAATKYLSTHGIDAREVTLT